MKKNFVKKLALVMALTMAVGSAPVATAEAAAAPGFRSKAVNVKVGQTKKYNTENAKKYSVKFVIGNKSVAAIKYSKGSKAVKVTGVKEGTTKIRAEFKSYKTKKVTKVRIPVTVKAAEPVVVEAALSAVKQTASNAFTATFTADASRKFNKDSFSVAADGSSVLSVKSVDFAADGLSAKVTIYGNFTDGVTYNVKCGEVTTPLTATVGEVARVAINTASAQENVKTPIEFTLFDAAGIDVTPNIDLNSYCFVTITGSYSGADLDKASTASITMNHVGDTAEVTVTYNSNVAGAKDVTATQTITCVDAKAVMGSKLFTQADEINAESGAAKFYLGLSDNAVSVGEGKSDDVHFCAKEENGDVISYDSYSVESSNEDVASVSLTKDSGKYAKITVNGNTTGNAQINISASKNGKVSYYTIPVSVTKNDVAVRMDVSVTRPIMSDVDDVDYKGEIKAQLYDAKGEKVAGTYSYELITKTNIGEELQIVEGNKYTAKNAVPKVYTIKVTGADNETGKTFVRNVNVQVKALPDAAAASGSGIKVTYQIELANGNVLDQNPRSNIELEDTVTSRLYATYNGLFAGYVRADQNGANVTVASNNSVNVHADSQLTEAKVVVKYGNLKFDTTTNLLGTGTTGTEESIGQNATSYSSVTSGSSINWNEVDSSNNKVYNDLARTGLYTIEYTLKYANQVTPVKKTQTFTVKNTVAIPTVTVLSRAVSDFSDPTIKEALKTNVDMNNDISDHESITGFRNVTPSSDGNRTTVKYAVVKDNYGTTDRPITWYFWVPVNTTFRAE